MRTRWFIVLALLGIPLATSPVTAFNKGGRASMQFLKIGIGAHQTALGEAGVATIRDANAVFWNPALITGISNVEAAFSYTRWFAGMNLFAGSAGIRWDGVGVVAVSYAGLGYGDIEEALVTSPTGSSDTRTGQTFTGGDMLLGLSFSREFTDALSIGVTVKYAREELWNYADDLWAFDVGTYYDTGFKRIRFAMSAQNFTGSVKFVQTGAEDTEGYDVPLIFRIGASVDLVHHQDAFVDAGEDHSVMLALETVNSNDYGERWHVGAEYTFQDFLSLRGGYRFNYDEGNISFGVGIQKSLGDALVRLDYSYVSYEYLESPHRVSLTLGF
jgi:long-subunit fatty acid transport protein